MSASGLSSADLEVVESVLETRSGYVLDLTDATFADFFEDHGVDIDDDRFRNRGSSKAKRLRSFLRQTSEPLLGQVLAGFLELRDACRPEPLPADLRERYIAVAERVGGRVRMTATVYDSVEPPARLRSDIDESVLASLGFEPGLLAILKARIAECTGCIDHELWLASTILSGSVLETVALGLGRREPAVVNLAYQQRYTKSARPFAEWRLVEWIDVLTDVGAFSLNVSKYATGLREFRNYVHPNAQFESGFEVNRRTAELSRHVTITAIEDVASYQGRSVQPEAADA